MRTARIIMRSDSGLGKDDSVYYVDLKEPFGKGLWSLIRRHSEGSSLFSHSICTQSETRNGYRWNVSVPLKFAH